MHIVSTLKVLFVTKDSAVAHDFKVAEIFNKFYGELVQRSKLPDTGMLYMVSLVK